MTTDADQPPLAARLFGRLASGGRHLSETLQARPKRGLTWPLRGLLAASLAVPMLLLALAAWQNFRLVRSQAEERVMIEAGELREHALNTVKTYAIVLAWIDARTRGLGWDQIAQDEELHRFLSDLDTLPQIDEVWMADATGRPVVSGRSSLTPPIDVSDRDCFAAKKSRMSAFLSAVSRSVR